MRGNDGGRGGGERSVREAFVKVTVSSGVSKTREIIRSKCFGYEIFSAYVSVFLEIKQTLKVLNIS